jgi:hypothetical protein
VIWHAACKKIGSSTEVEAKTKAKRLGPAMAMVMTTGTKVAGTTAMVVTAASDIEGEESQDDSGEDSEEDWEDEYD